jgi:signal transduction histidine kinase
MNFINNLPIKIKLIALLLFVSFVTLIISSTLFVYNDLKVYKKNLLENLTALAGTVGANSRAAVYFGDKATATEILSSLKEDSQIRYAAIYNSNGEVFVSYSAEDLKTQQPQDNEDVFLIFKDKEGVVDLKQSIILKDKKIGEIHISADLKKYNVVINKYLVIVGIILLSTLVIAIILSYSLQNFISKPIQNLAKAIKEISNKKDYSIRAEHQYQDEIGDLYFGFNQMISQIEKREQELTLTNSELSKEVKQRERAENKLRFFSKELKRSNQELQDFAAIASHDLQEPLRKIITFGDRIAKEIPEANERGNNYIARMQNASERMKNFITDLLEYSKIESKPNPFEKVDLNKIFSDVLENLEIQILQSQAQISCDKLPTLNVDSNQIYQLFQNLISNAIKYKRPNDPPVVQIYVRSVEHDFWEIVIKDNGIGFDMKYLERIFKPFERLHGKSDYEGSGMGLTICKKIVTRHGGNISASSIPGEGSTFKFTLPEIQGQKKTLLAVSMQNSQKLT